MIIPTFPKSHSSLNDRFWSKVRKSDGCWEWLAGCYRHPRTRVESYGCFSVGSRLDGTHKMVAAHKVAWELENGEIPAGIKVCHHCDNAKCVRPEHLFLGTQADNMRDMMSKGRKQPARGSRQGSSKLSEEAVCEIRARYKKGRSGNARLLAQEYGVKPGTISDVSRRSWQHL